MMVDNQYNKLLKKTKSDVTTETPSHKTEERCVTHITVTHVIEY